VSQPKFVPAAGAATGKYYESPPRHPGSWMATRPGEVVRDGQPHADHMGSQGPDQGFAIKLARHVEGEVVLHGKEDFDDAMAGCVAVALKRASKYARGPMIHDIRFAFGLFGYFDHSVPLDLLQTRSELFAEVAHPHHYTERREIADLVTSDTLALTPADAAAASRDFLTQISAAQPTGH